MAMCSIIYYINYEAQQVHIWCSGSGSADFLAPQDALIVFVHIHAGCNVCSNRHGKAQQCFGGIAGSGVAISA